VPTNVEKNLMTGMTWVESSLGKVYDRVFKKKSANKYEAEQPQISGEKPATAEMPVEAANETPVNDENTPPETV
jgi:hypothetical protein